MIIKTKPVHLMNSLFENSTSQSVWNIRMERFKMPSFIYQTDLRKRLLAVALNKLIATTEE